MGYMKDSVNTEADDQYGADQACDCLLYTSKAAIVYTVPVP